MASSPEFIQNHRIDMYQLLGQVSGFALLFFLIQLIDEIDSVIDAHPFTLVNGCYCQGGGQMGFAGTGAATRIKL